MVSKIQIEKILHQVKMVPSKNDHNLKMIQIRALK
jgi:hypothetical protein